MRSTIFVGDASAIRTVRPSANASVRSQSRSCGSAVAISRCVSEIASGSTRYLRANCSGTSSFACCDTICVLAIFMWKRAASAFRRSSSEMKFRRTAASQYDSSFSPRSSSMCSGVSSPSSVTSSHSSRAAKPGLVMRDPPRPL